MTNYKDAGVDVERGYEAVALMKQHVARTVTPNVIGGIGSFGGMYSLSGLLPAGNPEGATLVAGTDGVGTKITLAQAMDKHDTIGIDCVAMCVNDIVCQGAKPLFFLDYIATGRVVPARIADIVKGVAEGCVQAGCALLGGETAEHPGVMPDDDYDLAGFSVGMVANDKLVTGQNIKAGHAVIGLFSSGVHSNGFSLVRKLFGQDAASLAAHSAELGCSWGEALLTPTRIYVKTALALLNDNTIDGIAHITGGGIIENMPRMLPEGLCVRLIPGSWHVPYLFEEIARRSGSSQHDMFNTYNMGIGMALAVPAEQADAVLRQALLLGERAAIIGEVAQGEGVVMP